MCDVYMQVWMTYTVYTHRYCASVILYFVATCKRPFGPLLLNKMIEWMNEVSCRWGSYVLSTYHSHPTLSPLAQNYWAHRYKLLSLTYKFLTTTQPPYIHKLISVQRPRSTRSSSVVTLARPPTSSSLKITDRSFRYASPCLWNQLPLSLRQPHSDAGFSIFDSLIPSPITSSSFDSPFCSSFYISLCFSLPAFHQS